MKHLLRLALIGTALPLAGCMTSGTNMHGDFQCRAPNGTCAPMSSIDAKAVAGIGGTTQPVGGIADPTVPREGRVITASADGSPPGRTSDRVLRVVFPAHIDASGIYHDESTAHAVVERGAWTAGMTGGDRRTDAVVTAATMQTGTADNLQAFKSDTSATSKLATLDEIIAARAVQAREPGAAATASPVVRLSPVATITPASAPMRPSRSPVAIDLREAAAAASAGPVAGLDPNFDTPDVSAIVAADVSPAGDACIAYHQVRWHGHSYRRPFKVSCPGVASVSAGAGAAAAEAGTTQALNLAALRPPPSPSAGQGAHTTIPAPPAAAAQPSLRAAPSAVTATGGVVTGLAPTMDRSVTAAPSTAGVATGFAPTTDRSVAAARVSMLAKPIIADQVRLGRADAKAAAPTPLGELLAGTGVTASAVTGDTPR